MEEAQNQEEYDNFFEEVFTELEEKVLVFLFFFSLT